MGLIVTDQAWKPWLVEWLDERCPGFRHVEGSVHTLAYVNAEEGAVARQEDVLTVCALSRFTPHSCEATLATSGAKTEKATRTFIWTVFHTAFEVLGKSRLYTFVGVENHKSIAIQNMLGLKQEAVLRDHFGPDRDAVLFGITKRDWQGGRWSSPPHATN